MAGLTPSSIAWQIALSAAVAAFGMFAYKLIKIRMIYYKLKKQGMPMPAWNFALGNILTLPSLMQEFPQDALQADIFTQLSFDFKESDNCFYMDIWPFTSPLLIVTSPEMAIQACQEYDLPKPDILTPFFLPFSGGPNLFDTNGTEWKRSRALFNSAFSANAILENTPRILPEAEAYVAQLRKHAEKGDTFSLDVLTCDYIMDIIGVITLDDRFLSMTQHNDLAAAMRSSIEWHCGDQELNPFKRWNPMRPYIHWRNGKIMDRYIDRELDKRYEVWKSSKPSTKAKSIMDITIAAYMSERKFADKLDAKFKKWATIQIRAFLFAGHDSTAATIVYSLYLLSKYPEAAAKVRAELDEVFGEGTDSAARVLKDRPQEINRLTYITAVIKETLRVFPPAAGMRGGLPGVFLRDKNGNKYPTEDINVWIVHGAIQRHPDYWPEPQKFIPERWLVEPGHPLYPPKGAWRPFEFGPRNCIGQTLVMLDVKITLAMIVREFDIHDQYEEWDRLHPSSGVKTVFGERAYQVPLGAAHPVHGFPCKVTFRGAK